MKFNGVQTEAQASQGVVLQSVTVAGTNFVAPDPVYGADDLTISLVDEGPQVRYIRFDQPGVSQGSRLLLKLFAQAGPGLLPVFWLPWKPEALVQTTIPAIPPGANVNDYDTYPKYFFTASLSGCSIFVKGPRSSPTIYHGGLNLAKINGSSGKFWKEQMRVLGTGFDTAQIKGLVHKKSYLFGEDREAVQAYKRWLESQRTGTFSLQYLQGSGLVFGVREGRNWTFYLQENAVMNIVKFVSEEQTEVAREHEGSLAYQEGGKTYGIIKGVERTPRKIGPVTLPRAFDKKRFTYSYNAETVESPVRVVETFPASYKADTSSRISYSTT